MFRLAGELNILIRYSLHLQAGYLCCRKLVLGESSVSPSYSLAFSETKVHNVDQTWTSHGAR